MMRSLWTGATGMKAQQTNVDNIANNLANVNTTGYKSQSTQFKSLLYQTLQEPTTTANGANKPTNAQVGLGTRVASIMTSYTQGAQLASANNMACCINGDGFYAVRGENNQVYYTRNGDFNWSLNQAGGLILTNNIGNPVLDRNGQVITLPDEAGSAGVSVGTTGEVAYRLPDGRTVSTNQFIGLFQFRNPVGLEKQANNLLAVTAASGPAMREDINPGLTPSTIAQGYLEGSNVNVADEMVNLIVAQRAYEMNSKVITTTDSMMDTANNLKR